MAMGREGKGYCVAWRGVGNINRVIRCSTLEVAGFQCEYLGFVPNVLIIGDNILIYQSMHSGGGSKPSLGECFRGTCRS